MSATTSAPDPNAVTDVEASVIKGGEAVAGAVAAIDPTIAARLAALEAVVSKYAPMVEQLSSLAAMVDPNLTTQVQAIQATVDKWEPVVEEVATFAENAAKQGHGITGVLSAVLKQMFGVTL